MARRDDDALSWGDDDPTLHSDTLGADDDAPETTPTDAAPARDALPEGFTAVGRGSERITASATETMGEGAATSADDEPAGLSNAGLLALGVVGGVYLLFSVGWLIGGLRVHRVAGFLVASDGEASPLWTGGNLVAIILATLAPIIWFAIVFWLTGRGRAWLRWLLLGVGVVLLVPWPFVMMGTVGA
jgi:hypothetical protein